GERRQELADAATATPEREEGRLATAPPLRAQPGTTPVTPSIVPPGGRQMLRPCAADGCPIPVERGYCADHAPKRDAARRSPSSYVTGTARWRRVKARVLRRDRHLCFYCGGHATTVDHVRPVSRGGDPFDERNLVASCVPCNLRKG